MQVLDELKSLIATQLNVKEEEIRLESNLMTDLGADSLDAVELIMEIEDHFGISINEEDAQSLMTVGDIVDYMNQQ